MRTPIPFPLYALPSPIPMTYTLSYPLSHSRLPTPCATLCYDSPGDVQGDTVDQDPGVQGSQAGQGRAVGRGEHGGIQFLGL